MMGYFMGNKCGSIRWLAIHKLRIKKKNVRLTKATITVANVSLTPLLS